MGTTSAAKPETPPASKKTETAGTGSSAKVERSATSAEVVGSDDFLPADEIDVPPAELRRPATSPPTAGAAAIAGAPKRSWGVAPIRWGGALSAGFRRNQSEDSSGSTSQVYDASVRASSYIMQPYIALVSGDLNLTLVRDQAGNDGSTSSSNLTGTSIGGNGIVSIFPQSRFPFQGSLSVSDSRSDGSFTDTNTRRTRLGLRQDYRPAVGPWSASGQYDRSELDGDFGKDTVDRIAGDYQTHFGDHSLSANGAFSANRSREQTTDDFYAAATHGYRFDETLSFNNTASITRQKFSLAGGGSGSSGDAQSLQLFSYASWVPADSAWQGTGNLRYFQTRSNFGGSSFENRNIGTSGSLTYRASRNLSFFGSLGLTSNGEGSLGTNQNLGINYSGDPLSFGQYNYNWYSSAAVSNSTSSETDSQRSLSASLGHSLQRSWQPTELTFLSANLNQSVSNNRSMGLGSVSSSTLSHGASLSLQANAADNLTGYISASLSDSRVMGDSTSSFQMFNLQVNGRWRINAYSELNSNLTWQLARQQFESDTEIIVLDEFGRPIVLDSESLSRTSSVSGSLGYTHGRVFGLRGLRYSLDFRANTNRDNSRRRGNPDALRTPDQATWDLDQRLRYRIGRLDTELQFRVAEVQDRRNSLIYVRLIRSFGAF